MLHLIEQRNGTELATEVADHMIYITVRDGSAKQRVSLQSRRVIGNEHLTQAINLMSQATENPPTPSEIAETIGISVRQLERLSGRLLNCSPKKHLTDVRLQKARSESSLSPRCRH